MDLEKGENGPLQLTTDHDLSNAGEVINFIKVGTLLQ
jgi:hypothetical protein